MTITRIPLDSENINTQNANATGSVGGTQVSQNAKPTFLKIGVSFENTGKQATNPAEAYQKCLYDHLQKDKQYFWE